MLKITQLRKKKSYSEHKPPHLKGESARGDIRFKFSLGLCEKRTGEYGKLKGTSKKTAEERSRGAGAPALGPVGLEGVQCGRQPQRHVIVHSDQSQAADFTN